MSTFASFLEAAVKRQEDDGFSRSVGAFEAAVAASAMAAPVTPECLRVFGLDLASTRDELKVAFRRLARETHPDVSGGSADAFRCVSDAYNVATKLLRR